MQRSHHAGIPRIQHLEKIQLAAAVRVAPALTCPVLVRARDERVEHPDGGHVRARSIQRHGEFDEEDLRGAAETVVSDSAWTVVAAAIIRSASFVREEDDFHGIEECGIGEDGGGGGIATTAGLGVGEGGAELRAPKTGGRAAVEV